MSTPENFQSTLVFPDKRIVSHINVNGQRQDVVDDGKPQVIRWSDFKSGDQVTVHLRSKKMPFIGFEVNHDWGYLLLPTKRSDVVVDGFTAMVGESVFSEVEGVRVRKHGDGGGSRMDGSRGQSTIFLEGMQILLQPAVPARSAR